MNELINLSVNEETGETLVSGRELHKGLEIKTRYNDWIKRMIGYGFVENADFRKVTQKRVTNNPKNPVSEITDHVMSLDMAKEISMIQKNEVGRKIRKYLIEVEKAWNSPERIMERALLIARTNLNNLQIENKALIGQIEEQAPKVKYYDGVLVPGKLITISDIAKDMGMSGRALNKELNERGIIYKTSDSWKPYANYHWLVPDYCDYEISEYGQVLKWTEKGREWIINLLNK